MVDATSLERNLNLVLQVMEITPRIVVCANLLDEARRKGIFVDTDRLRGRLGVPVVGTAARRGEGLPELMQTVSDLLTGRIPSCPQLPPTPPALAEAVEEILPAVEQMAPGLPNPRWVAYRLLEQDSRILHALESGEPRGAGDDPPPTFARQSEGGCLMSGPTDRNDLRARIEAAQARLGTGFRDQIVAAIFTHAESIAADVVDHRQRKRTLDERLDGVLTHPLWGWPIMLALLAAVFYITVAGANMPSAFLAGLLIEEGGLSEWCQQYLGTAAPGFLTTSLYEWLHLACASTPAPTWLSGLLIDGVYLCLAWVVSVMLPPMAIFLPIVHPAGGSGLLATRRVQSRLAVQEGRRPRETGTDHVHGVRVQRGRGDRLSHHRFTARKN